MSTNRSFSAGITGFTLIEVLVAVVVLAIGLLGIAGLQAASLRYNQTAYLRSRATHLAYEMADRMRANQLGVQSGNYHGTAAVTTAGANDCDDASDDNQDGQACDIAGMAGYDLGGWANELKQQLPEGRGVVCLDKTPADGTAAAPACDGTGPTYAIKIWWNEKDPGSDDGEGADVAGIITRRFVTSFQP